MTTPTISHWVRVDITLKHREDLTTFTIKLINRAAIDDTTNDYFPILLSAPRLGASSDREIVLPEAGSIRVLDSIGSLGVDRKFSDLLERYEIIDQPITILYQATEVGDNAPVFDDTQFTGTDIVFAGKVLDYDSDIDRELPVLEIRFDSRIFEKRVIGRQITIEDFPNAPLKNIRKYLPVAIGEDVQIRPLLIDADVYNPIFGIASTLNNEHLIGGVTAYYVKNKDNEYREVVSASDPNTNVFSFTSSTTEQIVNNQEYVTAFKLQTQTSYNYIITHIDVKFEGQGIADTRKGDITVNIYDSDTWGWGTISLPRPKVGGVIASGSRYAYDHNSDFDAGTDFYITFSLNKPLILDPDKLYYIGVLFSPNTSNTGLVEVRYGASGTIPAWRISSNGWYSDDFGTGYVIDFKAYAVKFSYTSSSYLDSATGYAAASIELQQKTAIDAYIPNPVLINIDLILEIDGLKDDSGGNISGSASSLITTPHHAIELLTQEWNGSAWSASTFWDHTSYSSTYSSGYTIAGALEGEYTLQDAIQEICQNSAYKIVLRKSGKLAPYAWGSELTSVARFTQENSKVIRHGRLDSSYVVNNIKIGYDKQLIYFDALNSISQGIPEDYTQILSINSDTAGYDIVIGNSEDLYSKRFNSNTLYNLINTSAQASRLADYLLKIYSEPPVFVVLDVPFDYYSDLELQNVIDIKHPSLPTYYGGTPNAKLPHYDGEEIDVHNGNVLSRAKLYRAQVEGLRINFNEDAVPTLQLTCRLLLSDSDPT